MIIDSDSEKKKIAAVLKLPLLRVEVNVLTLGKRCWYGGYIFAWDSSVEYLASRMEKEVGMVAEREWEARAALYGHVRLAGAATVLLAVELMEEMGEVAEAHHVNRSQEDFSTAREGLRAHSTSVKT